MLGADRSVIMPLVYRGLWQVVSFPPRDLNMSFMRVSSPPLKILPRIRDVRAYDKSRTHWE
jgi:hypothetical protein